MGPSPQGCGARPPPHCLYHWRLGGRLWVPGEEQKRVRAWQRPRVLGASGHPVPREQPVLWRKAFLSGP